MPEPQTDQWSARATVIGGIILACALVAMQFVLIVLAFSKPPDQLLVYIAAIVPVANLSGVAVGAIFNALSTRSGASVDDLAKVVRLTHVPGSIESMSAGVVPETQL